jgi:hypothetical protein
MKTNHYPFFLLLATILFFTSGISAQNTGLTGYKETTPYSQEFKKNIRTSDGGIIGVSSLGYNGRACKLNSSYQQVWSVGVDSIPLSDACETNDGNYILLGHALTTNYGGAVYIFKVNPAGTILFEKMYSSGPNNQLTAEGVCKAAGTDSGFVFYGGNCIAMHYLIKCDLNGNVQWERQHVGLAGGAYVTMIAESNGYVGDFNCPGPSFPSIGIAKMDVMGNITTCKIFEGACGVAPFHNSLTKKNNGDYYIWVEPGDSMGVQDYIINNSLSTVTCKRHINSSGVQLEVTGVVATQNANDDVLMSAVLSPGIACYLKLNSTDNFIYQKQYTTFPSYFNSCAVMGGGTYLLGGSASTPGKIIAIVDENGAGVCATTNLNLNTSNYSITTTTPTISNAIVGAQVAVANLPLNAVVQTKANVCGALAVENNSLQNSEILVYPNPTNSSVSFDFNSPSNGKMHLQLFDYTGKIVLDEMQTVSEGQSTIQLDMESLSQGIYSLKVQLDQENYFSVTRVVKLAN